MSIYEYDNEIVSEQLMPPRLRRPAQLSWLYVITSALQNLWALIFEDYRVGSSYADYDNSTAYSLQDRVRWTDKAIYECISPTTAGTLPNDATYWIKVNEVFIGTDERIKYSAQKLLFEFALNKFFITTGIYIQNNFLNTGDVFVMDTDSLESSVMPLDSFYQEDYMDYTATYATGVYDYTIFVPVAFYTSLGTNADLIIKTFAEKYNLAGMLYDIQTY